jgi:hypothetical protein
MSKPKLVPSARHVLIVGTDPKAVDYQLRQLRALSPGQNYFGRVIANGGDYRSIFAETNPHVVFPTGLNGESTRITELAEIYRAAHFDGDISGLTAHLRDPVLHGHLGTVVWPGNPRIDEFLREAETNLVVGEHIPHEYAGLHYTRVAGSQEQLADFVTKSTKLKGVRPDLIIDFQTSPRVVKEEHRQAKAGFIRLLYSAGIPMRHIFSTSVHYDREMCAQMSKNHGCELSPDRLECNSDFTLLLNPKD